MLLQCFSAPCTNYTTFAFPLQTIENHDALQKFKSQGTYNTFLVTPSNPAFLFFTFLSSAQYCLISQELHLQDFLPSPLLDALCVSCGKNWDSPVSSWYFQLCLHLDHGNSIALNIVINYYFKVLTSVIREFQCSGESFSRCLFFLNWNRFMEQDVESRNYCVIEFQARDVVYIMAAFDSTSLAKVCSCLPNNYFTREFFLLPFWLNFQHLPW